MNEPPSVESKSIYRNSGFTWEELLVQLKLTITRIDHQCVLPDGNGYLSDIEEKELQRKAGFACTKTSFRRREFDEMENKRTNN